MGNIQKVKDRYCLICKKMKNCSQFTVAVALPKGSGIIHVREDPLSWSLRSLVGLSLMGSGKVSYSFLLSYTRGGRCHFCCNCPPTCHCLPLDYELFERLKIV